MELVIFDCDGVLVDSEVLVAEVEAELVQAEGAPMSAADILDRYVGLGDAEMHRRVEAEFGIALSADFAERKAASLDVAFGASLAPVEGIAEAVAAVSLPKCVASSSSLPRIRRCLELTNLLDPFEPHIYSVSMVTNGKPAPDLFLYVAEQMQAAPTAAVVVEDSPFGVAAGVAAGMTVIGFTAASHCSPATEAELRAAGAHFVEPTAKRLHARMSELDAAR